MKDLRITTLILLCIAIIVTLALRVDRSNHPEMTDVLSQNFIYPAESIGDAYSDYNFRVDYMLEQGVEIPESLGMQVDKSIHVKHRRSSDAEIFYLLNLSDEVREIAPEFAVSSLQPELWDPAIGTVRDLPSFERRGNLTAVPLKLNRCEGVFVVFRRSASPSPIMGLCINYPEPNLFAVLKSTNWQVEAMIDRVVPRIAGFLQGLVFRGTQLTDPVTKYAHAFKIQKEIDAGGDVIIEFEKVLPNAKVWVNGNLIGDMWTSPQRFKVSDSIRQGDNEVMVQLNEEDVGMPLSAADAFGTVEVYSVLY